MITKRVVSPCPPPLHSMTMSVQRSLLLVFLLSTVALGIALVSQHVAGMRPCAWCVFQRLILVVISLAALAGLVLNRFSHLVARLCGGVVLALGCGGVVAAWYQYSVAAVQFSCDQTFADRFMTSSGLDASVPWLFGIYATCMDARVDLLGVEYALWALALFVVLTLLGVTGLFFKSRA